MSTPFDQAPQPAFSDIQHVANSHGRSERFIARGLVFVVGVLAMGTAFVATAEAADPGPAENVPGLLESGPAVDLTLPAVNSDQKILVKVLPNANLLPPRNQEAAEKNTSGPTPVVTNNPTPTNAKTIPTPETTVLPSAPNPNSPAPRQAKPSTSPKTAKQIDNPSTTQINSRGTPLAIIQEVFTGIGGGVQSLLAPRAPELPDRTPVIETSKQIILPLSTMAQFESQRLKIEPLIPTYKVIAKEAGLPWQYLAALHYRESTNDPARSVWDGQPLGEVNWDHGDIKGTNLEEDALKALEHFKYMANTVYGVKVGMNNTAEEMEKAFLAYNRGSMYIDAGQPIDSSPYVMNGLDENHLNMSWPNSVAEPPSTRGYRNVPLGAMVIAVGLGLNPS